MNNAKEILLDSPIIAAVKDDVILEKALSSECRVIFLLYGSILTLNQQVQKIRQHGKLAIVHIDLIEGVSNRDVAVDVVARFAAPDGIISTKTSHIRRAQQLGLVSIQRAFLLDSMSIVSLLAQMESNKPDFIEVLPGILPSIITEITNKVSVPLIAGGLIRNKQDVIQALHAGAMAVSTTSQTVWDM